MALALVAFSSGSSHPRNLSSARVFSARSRATATLKTSPAWRSTSKSSLLPIFSYRALAFHGKVLLVLLIWQFAPRFDPSLSECAKISRFFLGSGRLDRNQRRGWFVANFESEDEAWTGDPERSVHVSRREKSDGELLWNEFRWHSRLIAADGYHCIASVSLLVSTSCCLFHST